MSGRSLSASEGATYPAGLMFLTKLSNGLGPISDPAPGRPACGSFIPMAMAKLDQAAVSFNKFLKEGGYNL